MSHDSEGACVCCSDHNPNPMELHRHHVWPKYYGGPDIPENLVWVCPTTHVNVHELLREYEKAGGRPSWEIEKRFGPYTRKLALMGWERRYA